MGILKGRKNSSLEIKQSKQLKQPRIRTRLHLRANAPVLVERIQKLLAGAGLGSRREIEAWIAEGRVQVNGRPAVLGERISARDEVRINGRRVRLDAVAEPVETVVLAYHKPQGEVCTLRDEQNRPTVFERLPMVRRGRWINIGRLDVMTSGLLLFTNDGELAHRMMHPSHEIEREYAVRVLGEVDPAVIRRLQTGVELEDGQAHFDSLVDAGGTGANHWYHVTLREGRNREVKRLWESQGITVSRLIRIRYGAIHLLRHRSRGEHWFLPQEQVAELKESVGMVVEPPPTSGKRPRFDREKTIPRKPRRSRF
jgi:23S rRNA pseudouridine2605 synthase